VGEAVSGPTLRLTGTSQVVLMPLPSIEVTDPTGDATPWRLAAQVEVPHETRSARLRARAIVVEVPGMAEPVRVALLDKGRGTANLVIPHRAGTTRATLPVQVEVELPASGRAGRYLPRLAVAMAPAS
jgi:hypothetical protein